MLSLETVEAWHWILGNERFCVECRMFSKITVLPGALISSQTLLRSSIVMWLLHIPNRRILCTRPRKFVWRTLRKHRFEWI